MQHRAGVDNTNADCLSRFPLVSDKNAPVLDWSRGEILPCQAMATLGGMAPGRRKEGHLGIWGGATFHSNAPTHQRLDSSGAGQDLPEGTGIPMVGEQPFQTPRRRNPASSPPAIGKDEVGIGYSSGYEAFWSAACYRSIAKKLLLARTGGYGGDSGANLPTLR